MTKPDALLGDKSQPWKILVVDDDQGVHEVTKLAIKRHSFFGREIEMLSALSAREAEKMLPTIDSSRLAIALVDVVMEHDKAGLELVAKLRIALGTSLQVILRTGQPGVIGPEEVSDQYEISNYVSKHDATPERLRTMIRLGIRNFRVQAAMAVLCDSLASFTGLFEAATTMPVLDQILNKALVEYSTVWQFDYVFIADLRALSDVHSLEPAWKRDALKHMRALEINSERPIEFVKFGDIQGGDCWGCSVRPVGGQFAGAFAFRQPDVPTPELLRELQTLLRAWALSRESILLKQAALEEEAVRTEMQRERRDSIAQMVAGVAHEVNTPLGVANAAAGSLAEVLAKEKFKQLQSNSEFTEDLEDAQQAARLIQRNIGRADDLIRSFKNLSVRQLVDKREEVDLLSCVKELIELYRPKARRAAIEIVLNNSIDPNRTKWLGYPGHLSQVLMNFLGNAERYAYADGKGGKVDITVSSGPGPKGDEFAIVVRDYGAGIPKENIARIYEPFFTTGRGKGGTGLGLSIVHNIVTSVFDGAIDCESTPGEGTSFALRFSHCKEVEQESSDLGRTQKPVDTADRIKIIEEFVGLQQRLLRKEALPAAAQLRLGELRAILDCLFFVNFQGADRREAPRVPCRREVSLLRAKANESVLMRDVSTQGASVLLKEKPQDREKLRIRFSDDPELVLEGEVTSCVELRSTGSAEARWSVGVSFPPLTESELQTLNILLAKLVLEYWQ